MYDNKLIVDTVEELNQELYDKLGEKLFYKYGWGWSYEGDGTTNVISFNEYVVYHSDNDEREFFEEIGKYEDLKGFCYKELKKYSEQLNKFLNPEDDE